ncbi:hypothetical protein [Mesorhizobium sp. L-2-11]|uniref:hypothetical protein n=1 Tax=Mesorhizobium sp. L-2-11 TaxID=2744521 RepID=UPI0019279D4A|nr:hypothetical protein [Mesorhizobium sp. L-2-11]
MGLSRPLASAYAEAFRRHHASASPGTRKQCWIALKTFARFLATHDSVVELPDLTTDLFGGYILWLDALPSRSEKPCAPGLRYNRYQPIKALTEWIARQYPKQLPVRPSFPFNPFPGRHDVSPNRHRLSGPQLKAILRACYEEIDAAWSLFEAGKRVLATPDGHEDPDSLPHTLRLMNTFGGGVMPPRRAVPDHLGRRLHLCGGHDQLEKHLHATSDCLAAFYIALVIQTAGNADALRLIDRDCIEPHPLVEHRVTIDWRKGRAGHRLKRAQRRSFDRRRPYAAPNLIEKLLAMTAPLAAHAPAREGDHLFLMRSPSHGIGVIQRTTLYTAIARLVGRANARVDAWNAAHPDQPRIMLPPFNPMMFRGSVAIEHYRASGGDVRVAQNVLNHSDASLTDRYIRSDQARRIQHETIARLQGLMLAWIQSVPTDPSPAAIENEPAEAFGHRCLKPFTEPDRRCPSFGGCLACPGLIVPIDAAHLARVLSAIEQLHNARAQVDPRRWAMLYKPSHDLLVSEILPDFPAELHVPARAMMAGLPPLPALE